MAETSIKMASEILKLAERKDFHRELGMSSSESVVYLLLLKAWPKGLSMSYLMSRMRGNPQLDIYKAAGALQNKKYVKKTSDELKATAGGLRLLFRRVKNPGLTEGRVERGAPSDPVKEHSDFSGKKWKRLDRVQKHGISYR